MSFLPQSRIVRDLLWIGGFVLIASVWPFFAGNAIVFIAGVCSVFFGLGILFSAVWVQFRLVQIQRRIKD